MYAVLNPDGSVFEIRGGDIDPAVVNTDNREKRYAVPFTEDRPALKPGERHVFVRRDATPDGVTDVYASETIVDPPPPRDLAAEIDTLKADLARAKAAEAVLIEKAVVTKGEIDAKVTEVSEIPVKEVAAGGRPI